MNAQLSRHIRVSPGLRLKRFGAEKSIPLLEGPRSRRSDISQFGEKTSEKGQSNAPLHIVVNRGGEGESCAFSHFMFILPCRDVMDMSSLDEHLG